MGRRRAIVASVLRFSEPFQDSLSTVTPNSPRAFIFDVDGTLVDSVDLHARAWHRTLSKWGHPAELAAVRAQIGKGGDQLMPVFLPQELIERDGETIEAERGALFKGEYLVQVRPFPAVAALFRHLLARGQRIALGSSGKSEEVDHYKRLLGIDGLDLLQTTSDDAERSKPHPDIFQAALAKLGLPAGDVLAVGDTPYDAEAAVRAGITPVGVRCGGFDPVGLTRAGCIALFDDPADMLAHAAKPPLC